MICAKAPFERARTIRNFSARELEDFAAFGGNLIDIDAEPTEAPAAPAPVETADDAEIYQRAKR